MYIRLCKGKPLSMKQAQSSACKGSDCFSPIPFVALVAPPFRAWLW